MRCAWKELLSILPVWLATDVDKVGKETLQEIRLRKGFPAQYIMGDGRREGKRMVTEEDLAFCVNTASRYSPWTMATAAKGYLTAHGGHRIGMCGEVVVKNGVVTGMKNLNSLCIRVARDFPGIGESAPQYGALLILGAPGWGKTTLLRDIIRCRSGTGCQIGVVDERGELFPAGFYTGRCTDVLTGCGKPEGIPMLLRTMGPQCIAVDEITQEEDCLALAEAGGCGVELLATAHASSIEDLNRRAVYRILLDKKLFDTALVLRPDKSWRLERIRACI